MRIILLSFFVALSVATVFANEEDISPSTITSISAVADLPSPFGRVKVSASSSEPTQKHVSNFLSMVFSAQNRLVQIPERVLNYFSSPQLGSIIFLHGPDHDGKTYVSLQFLFDTADKQGRFSRGTISIKDGKIWAISKTNPDGQFQELGL